MKKYHLTEKQLEKLKKLHEKYLEAPREIDNEHKEMALADGLDETNWQDLAEPIENGLAETNRELKFLIEDIEMQEYGKESAIQKELAEMKEKYRWREVDKELPADANMWVAACRRFGHHPRIVRLEDETWWTYGEEVDYHVDYFMFWIPLPDLPREESGCTTLTFIC